MEIIPTPSKPLKRKEHEGSPKPPEHIPGMAKLCAYLLKTQRGWLCGSITKYDEQKQLQPDYPWAVEGALTEDLTMELSKGEKADRERVNELRSMMYAASWEASEAPDEKKLLKAVPSLKEFVAEKQDKKDAEALASQIDLIANAIKERPCDEAGEPAVRAIEQFTNDAMHELGLLNRLQKEKRSPAMEKRVAILRQRMHAWRPIRNYLYYYRAYKRWCEISHAT